ncbi:MAG: tRNA (N(6)-L-threonylcarbamoyladenosine(37)-C(2))-methylthiotransferase MtaB [Bacteroidales bacterium]|nr:tRNA (N(6)-L-threonylcarbamoyladenosine(37)-C(2))-methylthiotransferase MtaB [Bacteroidales bacterium]
MGKGDGKKIAFLTLGCKLNYAETSTYERGFVQAGLEVVPWSHKADVYLVNTCSVTATSDAKSRNLVRKVLRVNPLAIVVVTGCSAQLRRSDYESIPGVARVFGCNEKSLVVSETLDILGGRIQMEGSQNRRCATPPIGSPPLMKPRVATDFETPPSESSDISSSIIEPRVATDLETTPSGAGIILPAHKDPRVAIDFQNNTVVAGNKGSERSDSGGLGGNAPRPLGVQGDNSLLQAGKVFPAWSSGERTRSFLKVQDGCNNYCAYCTVPYARGESRNVPVAECVANAKKAAALGVKEIVLTGVNTGDFGRTTGETFLQLLQALNEVDGIERYRISSIEPNLLTEEIIDWIASGTKFQPHFHIPLQTGTDEMLRAMGRKYDTALFASRIDYIRRAMEAPGKPLVFFGIDVMCGLPGETDELFARTCEFLSGRIRPAFIHVFPYSRRPGTPAASMPGQVPEAVKKERVAALEAICERLHSEFVEANRGVHERVLFESTDRSGWMEGYTGNYIRIRRPWDAELCGKLIDVTI